MATEYYLLDCDTDDKQVWGDWAGHIILCKVYPDDEAPPGQWEQGDPIDLGEDQQVLSFDVGRLARQGLGLDEDYPDIHWRPFPGTYVHGGSGGFQEAYTWLVQVERPA